MHALSLHKMSTEISGDPIHRSNVAVPNNAWGFAGYVLAKFGPWGAILIILAAIMWFFTVVYADSKTANSQLVQIVQKQSETTAAQAIATAAQGKAIEGQTAAIANLNVSTQGLKFSVDQMSRDIQDKRP
jgi:hypothetical protein